jgi:hypothetical protein
MIYPLKPWTRGAFELIAHAEQHFRVGSDFDRRVALVGFDNAIEVVISTYLDLHPGQRGGRQYRKEDVTNWLANYHAKVEFLEKEARERGANLKVPCDEVVYFHKIRNSQYHTGGAGVPEAECLTKLRAAALDIFGLLFEVETTEDVLRDWLYETAPASASTVQRNAIADYLIDDGAEPTVIAGEPYAVSEALRAVDPGAYRAVLASIAESRDILKAIRKKYPRAIRPDIAGVTLVHREDSVYLKIVWRDGRLSLTDVSAFTDDIEKDEALFPASETPDENAERFVREFDAYSMIHCFELFTDRAADAILRDHEARAGAGALSTAVTNGAIHGDGRDA